MADYINNVAAADNYTPALTLGPNFDAKNVVVTIANNPVLMQFALGNVGAWHWTDEREFFAIPQSFRVGDVIGVKFRNANPGQIARVLATLAGDDDPDFQSGIPFTGVLSATGQVTNSVINGVTGVVSGAGAVLAGTGFTVARTGAGAYTITFAPVLSSAPVVTVTAYGLADGPRVFETSVPTANGFSIAIANLAGAGQDEPFGFLAVLPQ